MPYAPPKPCRHPGCPQLVDTGYCDSHRALKPKRSTDHHRARKTASFRRQREAFLRDNPFCAEHDRHGVKRLGGVLDHIKPHRGDDVLFWDQDNWQNLCRECHNAKSSREKPTG